MAQNSKVNISLSHASQKHRNRKQIKTVRGIVFQLSHYRSTWELPGKPHFETHVFLLSKPTKSLFPPKDTYIHFCYINSFLFLVLLFSCKFCALLVFSVSSLFSVTSFIFWKVTYIMHLLRFSFLSLCLSLCLCFCPLVCPSIFLPCRLLSPQFVVLCFWVTAEDFSFSCFVQCLKLLVLYKQFTPGALKLLPEWNGITINVSNYFCQRGCVFGSVCVHVFHSVCKCGISKSSKLILVNFVEWGDVKTPLKFALHPPRPSRAA